MVWPAKIIISFVVQFYFWYNFVLSFVLVFTVIQYLQCNNRYEINRKISNFTQSAHAIAKTANPIQKSAWICDSISSNLPIVCHGYVTLIVLPTIFSMAWYKIVICNTLLWCNMQYPTCRLYFVGKHTCLKTDDESTNGSWNVRWYTTWKRYITTCSMYMYRE